MRHVAAFLCALVLVAGCTSGGAVTPGASPTPPRATGSPTAAPTPSPIAVRARVTFDGKTCRYTGPTVIPSPVVLTIEYAPTPAQVGSQVMVIAARSDTTPADIARVDNDPAYGVETGLVPEWADANSFQSQVGNGSGEFLLQVSRNVVGKSGVFDKVVVSCLPTYPGRPAPGSFTILRLVETTAPVPDPSAAP